MPTFYITTYAPLVTTASGRAAAEKHTLPPFIDGSIRREPDLEHKYPAISCLCRADKFAPRLEIGDYVAYMTKKARYGPLQPHRRLTAILRVHRVFASHRVAAEWYERRGLPLPSNCVAHGNKPKPLDQSHREFQAGNCASNAATHEEWANAYGARAKEFPVFVACKAIFRCLDDSAPVVNDRHLRQAFGCIPGTQNPGAWSKHELWALLKQLGLKVKLHA